MNTSFQRLPLLLNYRNLSEVAHLARENFQPVIGLEVHVQLNTKSKLFSRAPCADEGAPNSQLAAFDMATPGTLPVLNRACVMHALRMATLLNCEISPYFRFDRKHYFYADMPAGYQITQNEYPLAKNGRFIFHVYGKGISPYSKEIGIKQLQLEQDSGKTIHCGSSSFIDLNRAGVPLVEVVSNPDFSTALEAMCFVQQLRLLLMHHQICKGEMHKGHLRVDANISLSRQGVPGVRTEVKNINSFRHLHTAINFEIDRQYGVISSGGTVVNETRMFDQQGRTTSMRDKEVKTDYRFTPEPNLPVVKIRPEWVKECKDSVSSPPIYVQYQKLGFEPRLAVFYAEDAKLSRFVDLCAERIPVVGAQHFVAWLDELKIIMQRRKEAYPPQNPKFAKEFMTIVELCVCGRITKLRGLETLRTFVSELGDAKELFDTENLWRITDENTIHKMVEEMFERNEKIVDKAIAGHAKSVATLKRLLVDHSGKRIDVDDVLNAITKKLSELRRKPS